MGKRDRTTAAREAERRTLHLTLGNVTAVHFRGGGTATVLDGVVTSCGAPLETHRTYSFMDRGVELAAQSATARVEVSGVFSTSVRPVDSVAANVHALLDAVRVSAWAGSAAAGPVVMIAGNVDTGKSTLATTLTNLALRKVEGRAAGPFGVAQVELDIGQAGIAVPGAVSAAFLRTPLPPDDEHDSTVPLSFFYGDKTVSEATAPRYIDACRELRRCLENVGERDKAFRAGGAVVNTMGWTTGLGLQLLKQIVDVLRVTHIVVTGGDEVLSAEMRSVARASINGAVVVDAAVAPQALYVRDRGVRMRFRDRRIRRYFCGSPSMPLAPVRVTVSREDVVLLDALTLEPVTFDDVRPRSLAAVSYGKDAGVAKHANVAGFVVILDIGAQFVSLLTPSAGPLPERTLLVSRTIQLGAAEVPLP